MRQMTQKEVTQVSGEKQRTAGNSGSWGSTGKAKAWLAWVEVCMGAHQTSFPAILKTTVKADKAPVLGVCNITQHCQPWRLYMTLDMIYIVCCGCLQHPTPQSGLTSMNLVVLNSMYYTLCWSAAKGSHIWMKGRSYGTAKRCRRHQREEHRNGQKAVKGNPAILEGRS